MSRVATIYSGTKGLNTVLDPERLSQGNKNEPGIIELAQAVNVSIDDRWLASLREGSTLATSGNFSSCFCSGGDCFVVEEGASTATIKQVTSLSPLILTTVRSGLTKGRRMAWEQVNYDTFYSNGLQNGYIRGGTNYAWPVGVYEGPTIDAQFESSVPIADHITVMPWMQMALAVGPAIFLNHGPPSFQFGLYCKAMGGIGFDSNVTMICSVQAGFFASDSNRTWLFRKIGESWYHYKQELVEDAPALIGSLAYGKVLLRDCGIDANGYGRIWCSDNGVCLGTDDGSLINLTDDNVLYPSGYNYGASIVHKNTVITTAW